MTSWLIHYGFFATWEELENLIFNTGYPISGSEKKMRIFRACVDTGGGKKYEDMTMTEETYFWLLKNRGRGGVSLWGTRGSSSAMPGMLNLGKEIITTPSGKKLPGGLRILSVDTEKAKDQFHYRLSLAANPETRALPGAVFLHKDVGDDYAAQVLAEIKKLDERGNEVWVNEHGRPNHLLDADLLSCAGAEMEFPGGSLRLYAEQLKRLQQETALEGGSSEENRPPGRTGWFGRRG
jgi:phage terminase large subunit GpA-like protein